MRILKPAPGYKNMRKLTHSEGKELGLNKKLVNKIMIMSNEDGTVSFWIAQKKTGELVRYSDYSEDYFDEQLASRKLEKYWSQHMAA